MVNKVNCEEVARAPQECAERDDAVLMGDHDAEWVTQVGSGVSIGGGDEE